MTWHLNDRELEKKLNELSKGEFSKNLQKDLMKRFVYLGFIRRFK